MSYIRLQDPGEYSYSHNFLTLHINLHNIGSNKFRCASAQVFFLWNMSIVIER
jgi:hypothetical protein